MNTPIRRLTALTAVGAMALAACGGDDDTAAPTTAAQSTTTAAVATTAPANATTDPADTAVASTTEAPPATAAEPDVDVSGVTLRVGDTSGDNHLQLVFEGSGELAELPYSVEWSSFQSGPQLIAAQTGGSVDLGKISETPLVFAQGAGSPVKAVWAATPIDPTTSSLGILVAADSELRTPADLEGARVGYAPGTVLEYLLANALASADLTIDDITPIPIQPGIDLLATGNADAVVTGSASLSASILSGSARLLASGADFTPGFYYLVAGDAALADPAIAAAIGDFTERLVRAEEWYNANVDEAAERLVVGINATPEVARDLITRAPVRYGPITDEIIAAHQAEADFFATSGVLAAPVDAAAAFDRRYG